MLFILPPSELLGGDRKFVAEPEHSLFWWETPMSKIPSDGEAVGTGGRKGLIWLSSTCPQGKHFM